ncbi:MAG TPA: response regulator [Acidimicrobiales bacterium]|nr:response regulator [Acidimicrobiales bacterium]
MRALVVDDSRAMRSILSRILAKAGADEIWEAGDGREAIARIESSGSPDLVLVDWNMPVMNGLDFIVALRRNTDWRRVTIVMVTTENAQSQVVRALAAGAHEYLIKPFDECALLEKLDLLGLYSPEQAGRSALALNSQGHI